MLVCFVSKKHFPSPSIDADSKRAGVDAFLLDVGSFSVKIGSQRVGIDSFYKDADSFRVDVDTKRVGVDTKRAGACPFSIGTHFSLRILPNMPIAAI